MFGNIPRKKNQIHWIFRQIDEEPEKSTTIKINTPTPFTNSNRRVGKPRINWAEETMSLAWNLVREVLGEEEEETDKQNREHYDTLNFAAHTYMF